MGDQYKDQRENVEQKENQPLSINNNDDDDIDKGINESKNNIIIDKG